MNMYKQIAIDFDGVLHKNSRGWQNGEIYDPPMEGALDAVNVLRKKGFKIVVFTAREDLQKVAYWLVLHGFGGFEVTNKKPQRAIAFIDDRAIRFTNWRDILNYF